MRRMTGFRYCVYSGVLVLSACGGHSDGNKPILVKQPGRFIDVQGLAFQSGQTTGVTGSAGEFSWELTVPTCSDNTPACQEKRPSGPTTFYVMKDVALPGDASPYVLPSLINGAYNEPEALFKTVFASADSLSSDPVVRANIKAVLLMMDADGNPANGIQIPTAVVNATFGSTVNWNSTDPTTDFAPLLAQVRSLDPSGTHNWPASAAAVNSHFDPRWTCAMVSSYTTTMSGPTFTNTDGFTQTFQATLAWAVMPTGATGKLQFSSMPYAFGGEFRFTTAPVQPGPTPTIAATADQYPDAGEFAPLVSPQLSPPLSLTASIDGVGNVTGTWAGGGYTGAAVNQYSMDARLEMSNNNGNKTQAQPFTTAKYSFLLYPIYLTYNTTVVVKAFHLQIDAVGNIWAYLSDSTDSSAVGTPIMTKMGDGNTINIANKSNSTHSYNGGYEWQLIGTFDQNTTTISGTLSFDNGSSLLFTAPTAMPGCSMFGEI